MFYTTQWRWQDEQGACPNLHVMHIYDSYQLRTKMLETFLGGILKTHKGGLLFKRDINLDIMLTQLKFSVKRFRHAYTKYSIAQCFLSPTRFRNDSEVQLCCFPVKHVKLCRLQEWRTAPLTSMKITHLRFSPFSRAAQQRAPRAALRLVRIRAGRRDLALIRALWLGDAALDVSGRAVAWKHWSADTPGPRNTKTKHTHTHQRTLCLFILRSSNTEGFDKSSVSEWHREG